MTTAEGLFWLNTYCMYLLLRYNTPSSLEVEAVIISVGINDCKGNPSLVQAAISRSYTAAWATFPKALVYIPVISFPQKLSSREKVIRDMNNHICGLEGKIPALQPPQFQMEMDGMHWTQATAKRVWEDWKTFLDLGIWEELNDNSQELVEDSVMNMSKQVKLNKDQVDLLYTGLKFIPKHMQHKWDRLEKRGGTYRVSHALKLLAFFQEGEVLPDS